MEESILTSIKKLLGIEEDYTHFDLDIIMGINNAFFTLQQLGLGPDDDGFMIVDKTKTWGDYTLSREDIEGVKIYVFYKVRLSFDPPTSSFLLESINKQILELEWRLNVQVDTGTTEGGEG